jgi:hypothetical protein
MRRVFLVFLLLQTNRNFAFVSPFFSMFCVFSEFFAGGRSRAGRRRNLSVENVASPQAIGQDQKTVSHLNYAKKALKIALFISV